MKRVLSLTSVLILTVAFLMISCGEKASLSSNQDMQANEIELINFDHPSFAKTVTTETPRVLMETQEWVTYKDGGELILEFKGDEQPYEEYQNIYFKATFKVFSETISRDATLVLRMYDTICEGDADVKFKPHGIVFSEPALLNIEIKGAKLDKKRIKDIHFYYVNAETGLWEKMKTKEIIVKGDEGYIKIVDAEIPHYSRYAVAYGR